MTATDEQNTLNFKQQQPAATLSLSLSITHIRTNARRRRTPTSKLALTEHSLLLLNFIFLTLTLTLLSASLSSTTINNNAKTWLSACYTACATFESLSLSLSRATHAENNRCQAICTARSACSHLNLEPRSSALATRPKPCIPKSGPTLASAFESSVARSLLNLHYRRCQSKAN